jgi:hypothetical protein
MMKVSSGHEKRFESSNDFEETRQAPTVQLTKQNPQETEPAR